MEILRRIFRAAVNSNMQKSMKLKQYPIFSYLGHVMGIRHNKHSWGWFLVNGHDIPEQRKQKLVRISLDVHQPLMHGMF